MSVSFDYALFIQTFPEMSGLNQQQAGIWFGVAETMFNNAGWPGQIAQAPTLLNFLTAHVAKLFSMRDANGNPSSSGTISPPGTIGRVSSASQGSVSVSTEWATAKNADEAWFMQTQYGATYWAMTAQFRSGFFVPPGRPRTPVSALYPLYPYRRY